MKSKTLTIIAISFIALMFIVNIGSSVGMNILNEQRKSENIEVAAFTDDWWGAAGSWFTPKEGENGIFDVPEGAQDIITLFSNMINIVGTAVIVLVTIVLGIKYMFGSVDGKAEVKESLVTLVVVCFFFFGWQGIWNLLTANQTDFIFASRTDTSWTQVVARIYTTAVYILQFLAILAIIYVGIKYIFAGASGKADLKSKSGMFLIGAILTFATIGFLTYISTIVNSLV